MTRRERLERKLELRQEWADKRKAKANAVFARAEQYRGDYAFNTQPGHIPERARLIRAEERAFEDMNMANHHVSCAAGIATALDRSIFSDDDNAIQALEDRIAEHEAERTKMREINRLYRKGDAAGLAAMGADYEQLKRRVDLLESWQDKQPYAKYELSNLGGRISADRKRLEYLKEQKARAAQAEQSENGVTLEQCSMGYVRVTFAEKPDREILSALRSAGFHWGGGSWAGKGDVLPECVRELLPSEWSKLSDNLMCEVQ